MVPSPAVRYKVNAEDRLQEFNEGWTEFAEANDGREVLPSQVLGRVLWDFISDPTTIHLYQMMLQRLRQGTPRIEFTFRCDSPERRRLLSMELTAARSGAVQFFVRPVTEEERPPVAFLDATQERGTDLLAMCAWCQRVRLPDGTWAEIEDAVSSLPMFMGESVPRITHGICESCTTTMLELAEK